MKVQVALLALSLTTSLYAATNANLTTRTQLNDSVSRNVHNLMYDGFTGKVLVKYSPSKYTRRELLEIQSYGFDGVVVTPKVAPLVMKDAPDGLLVLAQGPQDPNLHITVPDDDTCGTGYWSSYWRTRHWVYFNPSQAPAIEIESWSQVKQGINSCSSVTASVAESSLQFSVGRAPRPAIDHFEVYISPDGENFEKLIDLAASASTLDMSHLALKRGKYVLIVKEVGIPLFRNYVSNEVAYERR